MMKKFDFDYDPEYDDLFIYSPNSKSKGSIEINDIVIDFNNNKEVSAIELLNASTFFKDTLFEGDKFNKKLLHNIKECKVEITQKNRFMVIKLLLIFKSNKQLATPIIIPRINEQSPALAY